MGVLFWLPIFYSCTVFDCGTPSIRTNKLLLKGKISTHNIKQRTLHQATEKAKAHVVIYFELDQHTNDSSQHRRKRRGLHHSSNVGGTPEQVRGRASLKHKRMISHCQEDGCCPRCGETNYQSGCPKQGKCARRTFFILNFSKLPGLRIPVLSLSQPLLNFFLSFPLLGRGFSRPRRERGLVRTCFTCITYRFPVN